MQMQFDFVAFYEFLSKSPLSFVSFLLLLLLLFLPRYCLRLNLLLPFPAAQYILMGT